MAPPASLRKRVKRFLRYGLVRVALFFVGCLPVGLAGRFGEAMGWLVFLLVRTERKKAEASLEVAFPALHPAERSQLAADSFRHLGRSVFELACVRQIDASVETWVEWPEEDRRALEGALAKKRGVLFLSGHVGNWELLARRVALAGFPCQTIAKETTDPALTRLVERFRAGSGLRSIWRGQEGAAKAMLRALRAGEILGMLIDQDTDVQSVFAPFFGRPAKTPRAAADLVLRTGCAVVVGFCHRQEGGRYRLFLREVEVEPKADLLSLTHRFNSEIEKAIRQHPAQWVWMHQRWKSQP